MADSKQACHVQDGLVGETHAQQMFSCRRTHMGLVRRTVFAAVAAVIAAAVAAPTASAQANVCRALKVRGVTPDVVQDIKQRMGNMGLSTQDAAASIDAMCPELWPQIIAAGW